MNDTQCRGNRTHFVKPTSTGLNQSAACVDAMPPKVMEACFEAIESKDWRCNLKLHKLSNEAGVLNLCTKSILVLRSEQPVELAS